jgi:hypothetical protein
MGRGYGKHTITVMEQFSVGATLISSYHSGDIVIEIRKDSLKLSSPDSEGLTVGNYLKLAKGGTR